VEKREDYEMGRLAEELIEKRYGDKLKAKDQEISDISKELETIKSEKTYRSVYWSSGLSWGCSDSERVTYYSVDELTGKYKESQEELETTTKRLNDLEKLNSKITDNFEVSSKSLESRLEEIKCFEDLPWYRKMFYSFKETK